MSHAKSDRIFRSKDGKLMQNSPSSETPVFATAIAAALWRAYSGRHSAVKVVAGAVGANERAVRNSFEGKNGPSGEHLIRLIRHSDEMLNSVLTMAGKRDFAVSVELVRAKRALERALAEIKLLEEAPAKDSR